MKKSRLAPNRTCPCDLGLPYAQCCGQWHLAPPEGPHAPTPEALMRSRYSAYVLGLLDYLIATWHPSTEPSELTLPPLKWLGLEVRHAQTEGDAGVVEFVARYRENGRADRLTETSRFVRQNARWYYIDGNVALAAAANKSQ